MFHFINSSIQLFIVDSRSPLFSQTCFEVCYECSYLRCNCLNFEVCLMK